MFSGAAGARVNVRKVKKSAVVLLSVCLVAFGAAYGLALPPARSDRRGHTPVTVDLTARRSPLGVLRQYAREHSQGRAETPQWPSDDEAGTAAGVASWARLWRELRLTARLGFVLPASAISLCLCAAATAAELLAPRHPGRALRCGRAARRDVQLRCGRAARCDVQLSFRPAAAARTAVSLLTVRPHCVVRALCL